MNNQPQPANPARRRRKWLRWLALPAGVAVLALVYQLTRPPELVWWRSPPIEGGQTRVRILIPYGWELDQGATDFLLTGRAYPNYSYNFVAVDRRPEFMRKLLPSVETSGLLQVSVAFVSKEVVRRFRKPKGLITYTSGNAYCAYRADRLLGDPVYAPVAYRRTNRAAFNRTYRQICNSLTIE